MLYLKSQGQGNVLVFLHGWALNGRVWDGIIEKLGNGWQSIAVDLPGHGKSDLPANGTYTLDSVTNEIASLKLKNAIWIGWSLGGMVAMELARRYPEMVKKLVLVAASPQFVASHEWHHAVSVKTVNEFAGDLIKDYRTTIMRFLTIQALGSTQAKQAIRALKEKVFINGEPKLKALEDGLELLKNTSLLENVTQIEKPVKIILGEKDTLIPVSSGAETHRLIAGSQLSIIPGAGHAPFISHLDEFTDELLSFIHE